MADGSQINPPPNPLDLILSTAGTPDSESVIKRNQQHYEFKVAVQDFSGSVDPKTRYNFPAAKPLNPQVIHELVINESLLDWYTDGWIIVDSNLEGFSAAPSDGSGGGGAVVLPPEPNYRLDCRDILLISIMPINNDKQTGNSFDNTFPIEGYLLHGEFVIYDIEDVVTDTVITKRKKLYFRDLAYQLMIEQRMQFSTNDNKIFTSMADPTGRMDNEVATGEILQKLLLRCNDPDFGFGWGDIVKVSSTNWDEGNAKIFYTAPANYTVADSINYILDRHVSKIGSAAGSPASDLCLFTTNRFTDEFELMPFSKLFELSTEGSQPGKYQIEHFFIPNITQSDDSSLGKPGLWRAPLMLENDYLRDVKLPNYGFIQKYQFVGQAGGDAASAVITRPVFSYDFQLHQFVCEYKENDIAKTKEYFKANYVDKMYGGIGGKPAPLLTLNTLRKTNKSLEPIFSTKKQKEARLNDGRNKTLFAALYLNEHISFTTLGSTNRTVGRFIGIDKEPLPAMETEFDYRLLGQYLVTKVAHKFSKTSYLNEINAIKIQSYKDLRITDDL